MGKFEKLYASLPVWKQNVLVSTYGLYWHWLRFGGSYKNHLLNYRQRERFTEEQWSDYQIGELKKLTSLCLKHVPYYRDHWNEAEKQAAINGKLDKLPLLDKEAIRQDASKFRREDIRPFPRLIFHTSGTTGTPIATQFTLSELRNSLALREARSANWAGVSFDEPRSTFSGRMVEPDPERETNIYRYNFAEKQVYFSPFHLKPKTAHLYIDALRKHNIKWLTGYAVSYYLLAKYILEQNIQVPEIKALITTSEKLTTPMRKIMEEAYNCKVYEEYSTVENALFASECECGRLHISPDVSIVEVVRPDGSPCAPGEVGEVVTTCLMRTYQPMIRFRLGDLAAWDPEPCPCGRQMPVIKEVVGRIEDVVTGPDGRQLVRFHGIFVDQPNVVEGQIVQEKLDYFVVKIVPTRYFCDDDIKEIKRRMHQRLGPDVTIDVEKVDSIPRTNSGKFQGVISNIR
jgi:phenylacetate-CoA ligase